MALLEWSEELSVNVREIDEQHRELLRMLNTLHQASLRQEADHVLRGLLGELMDYASYHFSTEERYMFLYNYSGFLHHVAEHEEFVHQVGQFQGDFDSGADGVPLEVMRFLSSWLLDHILKTDKSFGPHFNAPGLA